jgi:hypothetical protein
VLTFPKRSQLDAGIVVWVGEETISSMMLSIFCYLGKGVTAGSSFRDVVFKAGWRADGQITSEDDLFLSADPKVPVKVWK